MKRLTTQEFVAKARAVHGDRYDYALTVYVSATHKVRVICSTHGEYLSPASHHLGGTGCPECGRAKVEQAKRSTLDQFIEKARATHGYVYDYSQAVYTASDEPLKIICPDHGAFLQRADNHLSGFACARCGRDRTEAARRLDAESFFARCRETHGGQYTYPQQRYAGPNTVLQVICPEHGMFLAGARNHLWNKRRCPKCARQRGGE